MEILLLISIIAAVSIVFLFLKKRNSSGLDLNKTQQESFPSPAKLQEPSAEKSTDAADVTRVPDLQSEATTLDGEGELRNALAITRETFWGRLKTVLSSSADHGQLAMQVRDSIEEVLYTSDLGTKLVQQLLLDLTAELGRQEKADLNATQSFLRKKIEDLLGGVSAPRLDLEIPHEVWMLVGVNGVGKTTSLGKLASLFALNGKRVLVAAGDTFRAAAAEQLKRWSDRAQVEIYAPEHTKDPSAVAFEASQRAQQFDLTLIDTAGRLHTQGHLMEELKKIKRSVQKAFPGAPHRVLLVLDANSGQNALLQARQFHEALQVDGVIVTKLDGSAKGGIILGLAAELSLPVYWIGVGEGLGDLRKFDASAFAASLFPN